MQSSSVATASDDNQINLACFEVQERAYAIDVAHVREIVRLQEITPLPKAPDLIEGVVELRGGVVPVLDLGRVLGTEPCEAGSRSRIAVLECDGLVVGLCVEAATDVLSLDALSLEDVPALASHAGYEVVRAVVRRESSKPVMVLSLEHILESVYRSALPQQEER